MTGTGRHISGDDLKSFVRGETLDTQLTKTIELHLERCEQCQFVAASYAPDQFEKTLRLYAAESADVRFAEGYQIYEELGRGGAGVVFRGHQPGVDRDVAIKMLVNSSPTHQQMSRLRKEAEALAKVDHPNVVKIFDFGEQNRTPFIAMELVEGPTLDERLRRLTLTPKLAAKIAIDLADAIDCVHQQKVLHRDLKPQNVLLSACSTSANEKQQVDNWNFVPKISDFGLSAFTENNLRTRTGVPLGTPSYMSPEMARGDRQKECPATDVYGLGTILYQCLTGHPPFMGETTASVLKRVIDDELVPVKRLRPNVPSDLAVICERCLAKDPSDRFQTAGQLRSELQRFLDGKPILSKPPGLANVVLKWIKRNPWQTVSAISIVAVLLAIGIGFWINYRTVKDRRDAAIQNYQQARETIWEILDVGRNQSVLEIPELSSLVRAQTENALPLLKKIAHEEGSAKAYVDLVQAQLLLGTLYAAAGEYESAQQQFSAVKFAMAEVEGGEFDAERLASIISAQVKSSVVLISQGQNQQAVDVLLGCRPFLERLRQLQPGKSTTFETAGWYFHSLGSAFSEIKQLELAVQNYHEAIANRENLFDLDEYSREDIKRALADSRTSLATCQMELGKTKLANQIYDTVVEDLKAVLAIKPNDANAMYTISITYLNQSNILAGDSRYDEAVAACSNGIYYAAKIAEADSSNAIYANALSMLFGNRALFKMKAERTEESLSDWIAAKNASRDASTKDYLHCMWIRNLIANDDLELAEAESTKTNIRNFADQNTFLFASNLAWIATKKSDLETSNQIEVDSLVERIKPILDILQQSGALKDPSIVTHINQSDDFILFREKYPEEMATWLK